MLLKLHLSQALSLKAQLLCRNYKVTFKVLSAGSPRSYIIHYLHTHTHTYLRMPCVFGRVTTI